MVGSVIDYLKEYGSISLLSEGMNDIDSLALCQLSYLKFEDMVPLLTEYKASVSLQQIAEHEKYETLFSDKRYEKDNRALFEEMRKSIRFRNLRLNYYVNIVEKENGWETQFSAITYALEDGTLYIAFRGTDETIVGWKEDFNMIYLSPVPGQAFSVKYLNMVMGRIPNTEFYVGGHSKGGNLAVYSAMNCIPQIQDRISKVYSFDGPGFKPEVLNACGYDRIADRTCKILPRSSFFGMIFEQEMRFQVVESRSFSIGQHNPYSWMIEDGKFITAKDISGPGKFIDRTMTEWIAGLEEEQARVFVDALYEVFLASGTDNLIDFMADFRKNMGKVIRAMKGLDEVSAKAMKASVKALFATLGAGMKRSLLPGTKSEPKRIEAEESHPE